MGTFLSLTEDCVLVCVSVLHRERKNKRLLNKGGLIINGKLDGKCSHAYLLQRQRERVSEQLLNEGDLIISGKLDGKCS